MLLATPHSKQMIKRIENNLNTVDAAAFREIIEQHNTALRQAHDAVQEAIKSVASTYEQDPVDPTTLQVSINHLNESRAILNDVVGKILADSSTKISPEGRHLIAELK